MYEEPYTQERIRSKNDKKKTIIKRIMIIVLCIIVFLGGRASAKADKTQNVVPNTHKNNVVQNTGNQTAVHNTGISTKVPNISDWKLLLVNNGHPVPDNFDVDLTQLTDGQSFDKRAYPDLQAMMDDARAEGLSPLICSAYRTMEKQSWLYNNKVQQYLAQGYTEDKARKEAGNWVAIPGTSEHQIGLAVDIVSANNQVLNKQQENSKEQEWLKENCYKYGFILRYPENKSEITGIGYEPWHYRYVGQEAAAEITRKGLCLEEYLEHQ